MNKSEWLLYSSYSPYVPKPRKPHRYHEGASQFRVRGDPLQSSLGHLRSEKKQQEENVIWILPKNQEQTCTHVYL